MDLLSEAAPLWGQLPHVVDSQSPVVVKERQEIIRMKPAANEDVNAQLFLKPDSNAEEDEQVIPVGNPKLINSIQLKQLLKKAKLGQTTISFLPLPMTLSTSKSIRNRQLSEIQMNKLLRQAIVLICVDCGFDSTTESMLNLLTDITGHYLKRMCHVLRMSFDASELRSPNDFVDTVDRVFHEMAVPDLEALRRFQVQMNSRHQSLQRQAMLLMRVDCNDDNNTDELIDKQNQNEVEMTQTEETFFQILDL